MITFFRKTRKNLADDNKPLKYLRYAVGEIVLVVIGILIALQINNWNEERQLRILASEYEERLINDIVLDTLGIHDALPIRLETIENIEAYFERFETGNTTLKKALEEAIKVKTELYRYRPVNYTFEDMKATGNLKLLSLRKQNALLKLFYYQNMSLLVDEKLMESYYSAAEAAEAVVERRGMAKANEEGTTMKRSGMPFISVYDIYGIRENPERLAQGLIHRQNMLAALIIYHRVGLNRNTELLQLSKETIEILKTGNGHP